MRVVKRHAMFHVNPFWVNNRHQVFHVNRQPVHPSGD